FITEELWAIKGADSGGRTAMMALTPWPQPDGLENPEAEKEIGFVVDLVSEIRSVRAEINVPAGAQLPLVLVNASAGTKATVEKWWPMIARLARLATVSFEAVAPGQSAQVLVRGALAALPLAGTIDLDAERARLAKETDKLRSDIGKIDAKLGNADFLARAPEEVVDEQRTRKIEAEGRIARITEALERLKA
ncbi:MAG: class I tRNA ligase family protein, partial [Beijerinckiaceae bacterium]